MKNRYDLQTIKNISFTLNVSKMTCGNVYYIPLNWKALFISASQRYFAIIIYGKAGGVYNANKCAIDKELEIST